MNNTSLPLADLVVNDSDPWILNEKMLSPLNLGVIETLFSLGNGTVGTRGTSGYRDPSQLTVTEGTYLNGVYSNEVIQYDESAFGFAQFNNKMLQVANNKCITISTTDELFTIKHVINKQLNIYNATFQQELLLYSASGKEISLKIVRLVCQHSAQLIINHFSIMPLNFSGKIYINSWLEANQVVGKNNDDPRVGNLSITEQLNTIKKLYDGDNYIKLQQLNAPYSTICTASSHLFNCPSKHLKQKKNHENITHCYEVNWQENDAPIELTKYSYYNSFIDKQGSQEIITNTQQYLEKYVSLGFQTNISQHQQLMHDFWQDSDVLIEGNQQHQLAIRLSLLHLFMSAGKDGKRNIAAKGLTGPGYDGHYFWDSEIYITPFFIYNQPEIAKNLLAYRYNKLEQAKKRALQLGHQQGALFPWRTIGGDECSSYFPAGTAQYHINAAIAYAVRHYFMASNDWQFILTQGAELIFETARLWPSLGHFNARKQGQFCIDTVTGPDEYTALVNNNYYTNAMAKIHLEFALTLVTKMQQQYNTQYTELTKKIDLTIVEINDWQKIVDNMYLPHDKVLNINPQDDSFLEKKPWNFNETPTDKYPLLLHFHPLVIYRHQVLKQADVVLANFLQDDQVPIDIKTRNLHFYEPLTTHDSTLSACAHSLLFAEIGQTKKAFKYFEDTLLTDLEDRHNNSHYGIHTAAMGGAWMGICHGFAGFRMRNNYAYFAPTLPKQWQKLAFKLKLLQCQIKVTLYTTNKGTSAIDYKLLGGNRIALCHFKHSFTLNIAHPIQTFNLTVEDR